ncbi:MAG: hypothetical protein EAX96_20845 [Candidatus Lokiarchaeota archaeon]|nr:hypothetical protein [Candidatus Lokiarchaeota archaeon]
MRDNKGRFTTIQKLGWILISYDERICPNGECDVGANCCFACYVESCPNKCKNDCYQRVDEF